MWLRSEDIVGLLHVPCSKASGYHRHGALLQKQKGSSGMLLPQADDKCDMFSSKTDECFSMFSSNSLQSFQYRLFHIQRSIKALLPPCRRRHHLRLSFFQKMRNTIRCCFSRVRGRCKTCSFFFKSPPNSFMPSLPESAATNLMSLLSREKHRSYFTMSWVPKFQRNGGYVPWHQSLCFHLHVPALRKNVDDFFKCPFSPLQKIRRLPPSCSFLRFQNSDTPRVWTGQSNKNAPPNTYVSPAETSAEQFELSAGSSDGSVGARLIQTRHRVSD
jgi:hypothetical protein